MQMSQVDLDETCRAFCLERLAACNRLLEGLRSGSGMRFSAVRVMACQGGFDLNDEQRRALSEVQASQDCLGGRSVEEAVIQAHTRLAVKQAMLESRRNRLVPFEDYRQEAFLKLFEAMYRWLPERGCSLPSFLCLVIKKALRGVTAHQGAALGRIRNSDRKLMREFYAMRADHPDSGEDEVIGMMGLDSIRSGNLRRALRSKSLSPYFDVHESRPDGDLEAKMQMEQVRSVIDRSGLTAVERRLVESAMEPYNGWQTEFARATVSPVTGRPISKMRVTQMLKVARAKLAETIGRTA